ncbi:MAG TPA: PLDc N-terminal domain-containing protein [Candidatus Sphingobacterium stercorigallinarum]|nr:PLDc N-terminal domain-containing protein [Candidatus Sphingobacterium stercorigallinarum]
MYTVIVSSDLSRSDKVCWLVALFFFNIFAAIAYWIANYRQSANT